MRKLLVMVLLCVWGSLAAQQFNNEWIDYGKKYYRFKIATSGVYRISQSVLAAAGMGSADATSFQLWRNGKEVAIFTSSASGALGANGYIEFWGQRNDGKPDLPLYRTPDQQIADTRNLFSDSAAYFLTLNPGVTNKRLLATPNNIPTGVGPEPFFMYTGGAYYNDALHLGRPEGSGLGILYPASFEDGEGWASTEISNGGQQAYSENLFAYTGSGAPGITVKSNVVGNADVLRKVQLTLNGTLVFDTSMRSYGFLKLTANLPISVLNGGVENFVFKNMATSGDRIRVAFIEATYPRQFNFGGASNFQFKLPAKAAGYYLNIRGFTTNNGPVALYDVNNGRRLDVDVSDPAVLKVFIPGSSQELELIMVSMAASNIRQVPALEARNFVNYSAPEQQGTYLMITDPLLMQGPNGSQPIQEYRDYRASTKGGGFNAKVYLMDQLNDQFAFGIKGSPLGIRNFLRMARAKFTTPPVQVFLIGKGVNYISARANEGQAAMSQLNILPTFGYPGSDVLLSAEGRSSYPLTPIGRISVVNGAEVLQYLQKVKQYEDLYTNPSPLISESGWKKNILHIVGANDQATIELLDGLLKRQKEAVIAPFYGANVEEFTRSSDNPVQQQLSEHLAKEINGGAGMLTYFGHSSSTALGFNLEEPGNYSNQGKYPIFNMMGCSVGDIFGFNATRLSSLETISEKYVLAKERGSIGMMAGTGIGYVHTLDLYNTYFYKLASTTDYGLSIGKMMQNTISSVFQYRGEGDYLQRSQCEEFTLNGDPAMRLYQFDKPDYAVEAPQIRVSPDFISVAESQFKVAVTVFNLGKALDKGVVVELKRTLPNLSTQVIGRQTLSVLNFSDSLVFNVPINPVTDKGQNKITITIDPDNTIEELHESNNSITRDVFIFEDEIRPVFPYDFSIVNQSAFKFSASTADPFSPSRTYLFEMDTSRLFNSPAKITSSQVSKGGLVEFSPTVSLRDSVVYYWRVANTPLPNEAPHWNGASFTYIAGSQVGFNQAHYFQHQASEYQGIHLDADRQFRFDSTNSTISINSGMYGPNGETTAWELAVADVVRQRGLLAPVQGNTIRYYVVNNRNMQVLENVDLGTNGRYGSRRPIPVNSTAVPTFFEFDLTSITGRNAAMNFFDSIPSGYFIVITNSAVAPNPLPTAWINDEQTNGTGKSLYHKLKELGLSFLDSVKVDSKFIGIIQNKTGKLLKELFTNEFGRVLTQTVSVKTLNTSGSILSPIMGPAKQWTQLSWDGNYLHANPTDSSAMSLMGVDKNGNETLLINNITPGKKQTDLSGISAAQYPYLRMLMRSRDMDKLEPYQLKNWRLYGQLVPEGALAPQLYFAMKDTVEPGEPLEMGIAFKNVSPYNFDSIKVNVKIRDQKNIETNIPLGNQKALVAGDTIKLSVPINTQQFLGVNTVFLEFNPVGGQQEQYRFNNFLYRNFYVKSDSLNPFMDVTFDGVRILNRDIVSSKPDILIKLTDDAKWLLLDNPDLLQVQLKYPNQVIRNYSVGTDTLVFTPASQTSNNVATMNFRPRLEDGTYELIVSAKDKTGNRAGSLEYRVAFEVINKPMISNLLNYPNPFTTSTAFVFTLTGSELPQNIRIQILTITGKIVREITKAELGPINIGRNITEYKWDGTDQFGQKLANGVYLYRVITNLNGKGLEKYRAKDDKTDKYFNKGYGKMYLMR